MLKAGTPNPANEQSIAQTGSQQRRSQKDRNHRRERRLWHQPDAAMSPLGCRSCPDWSLCGGLKIRADFFDCMRFCCGYPDGCNRVCRNRSDFADWFREIGTFDLSNVPRAPILARPVLSSMAPILYYNLMRTETRIGGTVALPLYQMFDRRLGVPRFDDKASLCAAFGVSPDATILLTGTDRDTSLERWWNLGESRRIEIIRALKAMGVSLVTAPNYSLFTDRPRQDNLHSIKRIGLTHEEFLREGLAAALHTNGRTEFDFSRWADYVSKRPEITHIAYEFTTGTGWAGRQEQHAIWLSALANSVDRPLHLVVRGGSDVLPILAKAFAGVTFLDTSVFMKTVKRQRAYPKSNVQLGWRSAPTAQGAPVDNLFMENRRVVDAWVRDLVAGQDSEVRIAG